MVSSAAADKQAQDFAHIQEKESAVPRIAGPLKNRYFALRHGQSEANIADIISSDETRGSTIHGLTAEGRRQARASAADLLQVIDAENLQNLVVYSSNFTRARETAEEACAGLKELVPNILDENLAVSVELGLRERWFGELDNTIITNYNKVWPADFKDAGCTAYGVESVESVCERVREVITALESRHQDKDIVLVSHADTLQILQLYLSGADVRQFSAFRFKNGEVRALLLEDLSAMPPASPLEYKREDDH